MGETTYHNGDTVLFCDAAKVRVLTPVSPAGIVVDTSKNVTFTAYGKVPESGIKGEGTLLKEGSGTLTMNGGNTYAGGTTLNGGTLRATAADSFGSGAVTVERGQVDLGSESIANDIWVAGTARIVGAKHYLGQLTVQGVLERHSDVMLNQDAVLKNGAYAAGVLRGAAGVRVTEGDAVLVGKNKYKGDTYVAEGASLILGSDVAGNIVVDGTLRTYWNGITIGRGQSLTVNEGAKVGDAVYYPVYRPVIGYDKVAIDNPGYLRPIIGPISSMAYVRVEKGGTLFMNGGTVNAHPVLAGGTVVYRSADAEMHLKGEGYFGISTSDAPYMVSAVSGKASLLLPADSCLTVTGGRVQIAVLSDNFCGDISLSGGCLDAHKVALTNKVLVERFSDFISGDSFSGQLVVGQSDGPRYAGLGEGSRVTLNQDAVLKNGTVDGILRGPCGVRVTGTVWMYSKNRYKGDTYVAEGATLTLGSDVAGDIVVDGTLCTSWEGITVGMGQTLTVNAGGKVGDQSLPPVYRPPITIFDAVDGEPDTVTAKRDIGYLRPIIIGPVYPRAFVRVQKGGTLFMNGGSVNTTPVLAGGAVVYSGGEAAVSLKGKGCFRITSSVAPDLLSELSGTASLLLPADACLTVSVGAVSVKTLSGYGNALAVVGGKLKLAAGKGLSVNEIVVKGHAAVVNGTTHSGDITVDGTLAKGTNIMLTQAAQKVALNGAGIMLGTIAGEGTVDVNASIDATAAKITAAHINLNSGTYTNAKGIKLAKGQTLTLGGVALNLGPKKALATAAGSTLVLSGTNTLSGSLTLGGGELVFESGSLAVDGMLTLSKAMTVSGSGTITYTTLKPFKGDIAALFNGAEVELDAESGTLTINGGVEQRSRMAPAPLDAVPAPKPITNPVADAMVQADWGIIDAERAFMGAVNSRHQHAALLDKGQGAAWVSAFGASVRHGNKGVHHGSDGNIEGAAFGLEHAVSETGNIGLAVGRSKNRIAATGVTHLRQETAHVALYGQKQLAHGFTADAAATYGDTETKLGAASWQQKSAAITARLTHAQQLTDATAFRTFGGLAYEATESGSIGTAHTGSVQNVRGELGAGITHTSGKAHLYAEAALTGDMVRHNPTADLDGIRTHGANPGRIGVRATLGGLYEFTDTWSGTASYGIEAESRSTAHTLNIGVSKTF